MRRAFSRCLAPVMLFLTSPGWAVDPLACSQCQAVLKDGAFNTQTLSHTASSQDAFRAWQCTTELSNHDEARSFGISIGVPVYDIPIEVGGTFDGEQRSAWKRDHCSDSERRTSSFSALAIAVKEASPEILAAWTHCIDKTCSIGESMECKTSVTDKGVLFQAKWNRSTGDDRAPKVLSFRAMDAVCDKPLKPNSKLRESFSSTVCKPAAPEDVVFILETTRGSCTPVQSGFKEETVIESRALSRDTHIKADRIVLRNSAIVTNGFDLTLEAKSLRLEGTPSIVSFAPRTNRPAGEDGRNAGRVQVLAQRIEGTSLKIHNDGEDGTAGEAGARGQDGVGGQQGQQRTFGLGGCSSGSGGTQGGNGGNGQDGFRGGRAGKGGSVAIQTASPIVSGGVCRLQVSVKSGSPGAGGVPGAGGAAGPGGQGAPGNALCGGTGPGAPGSPGISGKPGPAGQPAACGSILPALDSCDLTDRAACPAS